jgi:hypothetical protein
VEEVSACVFPNSASSRDGNALPNNKPEYLLMQGHNYYSSIGLDYIDRVYCLHHSQRDLGHFVKQQAYIF